MVAALASSGGAGHYLPHGDGLACCGRFFALPANMVAKVTTLLAWLWCGLVRRYKRQRLLVRRPALLPAPLCYHFFPQTSAGAC